MGDQEVLLTVSEGTDVRFLKSKAKVWEGKETKQVRNLKKAKAPAKPLSKSPPKSSPKVATKKKSAAVPKKRNA